VRQPGNGQAGQPGDLQLRLLGPVELLAGGRPVDCGPARQRTVLAALGVDAGRLVPQDLLIARVWGDAPPPGVRSGLYSYVTRLRRVLHAAGAPGSAAGLVSCPGGYLLELDPATVDLVLFRRLTRAARQAPPGPAALGLLDGALALWRGPALAGLTSTWASTTRDLLEQRRVDAVLGWARAHLDGGRPGTVIGALRDLLPRHRLVEPLAARLIEALYADGRAAEALDCYAGVRAHLVAELGTEPGTELRQLHQAILRGDPAPAAPGAGLSAVVGTGLAEEGDLAGGGPAQAGSRCAHHAVAQARPARGPSGARRLPAAARRPAAAARFRCRWASC
jgi:DNA-binding SARP family transcriptional activator